jgi:drug/metabolite transporter (DMT)-like permease
MEKVVPSVGVERQGSRFDATAKALARYVGIRRACSSCLIAMQPSAALVPAMFGLAAAASYGTADFCGGVAAKRSHVVGVTTAARLCGLIMTVVLAVMTQEPWPAARALGWACAAGLVGGLALPAFYRALAIGKMGIGASVTSVLAAAVPVVVAAFSEGLPRRVQVFGLLLAMAGLWLISRPDGKIRPEGLGLAVLAGLGFGCFLVFLHLGGMQGVYWPTAAALGSSLLLSILILAMQRGSLPTRRALHVVVAAGVLDTFGNVFFVLASRYGRLDVAAVLSSLYPGVTVMLAWLFLSERITRLQTAGMSAALIAVPLIASH